jgi:hypothetical protein
MKRLAVVLTLIFTSCIREVIEPVPIPPTSNIFSQKENRVSDGEEITFVLESEGVYFLILIDLESNQIISKEKISGVRGVNKKNIYTKSIQSRYLYLVLSDIDRKEVNRTKLVF